MDLCSISYNPIMENNQKIPKTLCCTLKLTHYKSTILHKKIKKMNHENIMLNEMTVTKIIYCDLFYIKYLKYENLQRQKVELVVI